MFQVKALVRTLTCAMALLPLAAWPTSAQQAASAPEITLELNGAEPSDKGCRLTFVVNNSLGAELTKAAFEIALFNASGVVDRLTVLDFKELPAGKTKVTRFDLAGVDCAGISRILVNNATECAGEGVEPAACLRKLKTAAKAGIAFGM
jgi:hypothetical protein